jgi:hypothetical protein
MSNDDLNSDAEDWRARAQAAQAPQQKLATEMSHEEWRSARADLLKRR